MRFIEKTLIPCIGGPCHGLGLVVEQPIPLEIEHDGGGRYLLEERGKDDETELVYVYSES